MVVTMGKPGIKYDGVYSYLNRWRNINIIRKQLKIFFGSKCRIFMIYFLFFYFFYSDNLFSLSGNTTCNYYKIRPCSFSWLVCINHDVCYILNNFFLSTVQKFIPLLILRLLPSSYSLIITLVLLTLVSVLIIGITQTALKKLFAVSSLNNVSWLLIGTQINLAVWNLYLIIYMGLLAPLLQILSCLGNQNLAHSLIITLPNSLKLGLVILLLSLGGLPPFLGFFNKIMIIKLIISSVLLLLLIVCRSLILLYYYLSWSFFILRILPINTAPVSHSLRSVIMVGGVSQRLGLILLLFSCNY